MTKALSGRAVWLADTCLPFPLPEGVFLCVIQFTRPELAQPILGA